MKTVGGFLTCGALMLGWTLSMAAGVRMPWINRELNHSSRAIYRAKHDGPSR